MRCDHCEFKTSSLLDLQEHEKAQHSPGELDLEQKQKIIRLIQDELKRWEHEAKRDSRVEDDVRQWASFLAQIYWKWGV